MRRASCVLFVLLFSLMAVKSSAQIIGPSMSVSFLVNNETTDRDAHRYLTAGQTSDVVFSVDPVYITGPWACRVADPAIIIDSIEPPPLQNTGTGYIFAPTSQVQLMFHAAENEFYDRNVISCDTQTTTGQYLYNYILFRVAHMQIYQPLMVNDAPLGTVIGYPGP